MEAEMTFRTWPPKSHNVTATCSIDHTAQLRMTGRGMCEGVSTGQQGSLKLKLKG